jgi:hypothetical protein
MLHMNHAAYAFFESARKRCGLPQGGLDGEYLPSKYKM